MRSGQILLAVVFSVFMFCGAQAIVFSGANVPLDSSFHLGLLSGPGTGIGIGADMFFPLGGFSLGGEVETQVTNSELEQNINILKYGVVLKYSVTDDLYLTFHLGRASFYITKAIDYVDSFSGTQYTIDDDTYGSATYIAFAPNFIIGDFIVTPKAVINNIADGGAILEGDLNIGHRF